MRCRTLVDEFSNLSRTYRSKGKLELKSNDARNYKEDCHRLAGAAESWVAYQVTGAVRAIRLYAFGDQEAPELVFRTGHEGGKGQILMAQTQDYYAGKEMYNLKWPRLYTVSAVPAGTSEFLIEFRNPAQLSRLEIEYE
jgi:hypothetical protein